MFQLCLRQDGCYWRFIDCKLAELKKAGKKEVDKNEAKVLAKQFLAFAGARG